MSIHVICGCMFASKTSELHSLYKTCILANHTALLISHALDTRYSPNAPLNVSHDGIKSKCTRVHKLCDLPPHLFIEDASHIFIDEGQFFPDLVDFCLAQRKLGKHVVVAGLRSDADGKAWPQMSELVAAHADKVTFKEAVCIVCKGKAMYTRRRGGGGPPPPEAAAGAERGGGGPDVPPAAFGGGGNVSGGNVSVGSDEKYLPACYNHLFDPVHLPDDMLQERMILLKKSKETLFH